MMLKCHILFLRKSSHQKLGRDYLHNYSLMQLMMNLTFRYT